MQRVNDIESPQQEKRRRMPRQGERDVSMVVQLGPARTTRDSILDGLLQQLGQARVQSGKYASDCL